MASKVKCKYWDKCYDNDAGHKSKYLHPSDMSDDDSDCGGGDASSAKGTGIRIYYNNLERNQLLSYIVHMSHLAIIIKPMQGLNCSFHAAKKKTSGINLRGKSVVFTGALIGCTRKQAEAKASQYGCIPRGMVSKNTDIVVTGAGAGIKADKAEDLGKLGQKKVTRMTMVHFQYTVVHFEGAENNKHLR